MIDLYILFIITVYCKLDGSTSTLYMNGSHRSVGVGPIKGNKAPN